MGRYKQTCFEERFAQIMFSAAVVGLGNIGQGFDYDISDSSCVLTHASGFYHHPQFDLIAGVDTEHLARKKFEKKFGKPVFSNIEDLYKVMSPEIVSIGVPTALHFSVFQELIRHSPKAILCEKPLASSLYDAERMVAMAEAAHTLLLVNYMRRFEPGANELKQRINRGEAGKIYKGTVWYSKGILNNGSHFIDLLIFLLGAVKEVVLVDLGRKYLRHDPEPDLKIAFDTAYVYFLAGQQENFTVNQVDLMGTLGSVHYYGGGEEIVLRKTFHHDLFPDYTILDPKGTPIATDLKRYQLHVLDALYKALTSNAQLNSNGVTALETMDVMEKILTLTKEAGHV